MGELIIKSELSGTNFNCSDVKYKYIRMANELNAAIHTWVTQLTSTQKLRPHNQPFLPEHFDRLSQDNCLQPIFAYLVRHTRPAEERRIIRLNLKHHKFRKNLKNDNGDGNSEGEKHFRLKSSVLEAKNNIRADVQEITKLNLHAEDLRQKEVDVQRRSKIICLGRKEKEKEIALCDEWRENYLDGLLKDLSKNEFTKKNVHLIVDSSLQLHLRGDLLDIEKMRMALMSGRLIAPQRIHEQKVCLWERIEETMETWPVPQLLGRLVNETREATRRLVALSQQVNLQRDARELRLKCETDGAFIDEMNPSGVIESVRDLLAQMSATHVRLYFEAHKANKAADSLDRVLQTLNEDIASVAKVNYGDESIYGVLMTYIQETIAVAGEQAALAATQNLTATLQERADASNRARDTLKSKLDKINSFAREVDEGLENLRLLVQSVEDSQQCIDGRVTGIRELVSSGVSGLQYPSPTNAGALAQETEAFSNVPLSMLLTADVQGHGRLRKGDMSTTAVSWYSSNVATVGSQVAGDLCEGQRCWSRIYEAVRQKTRNTLLLDTQVQRLVASRRANQHLHKAAVKLSGAHIKDLLERVDDHSRTQEEAMEYLLEECEGRIARGHQMVTKLNSLLPDWWDQPAKSIEL